MKLNFLSSAIVAIILSVSSIISVAHAGFIYNGNSYELTSSALSWQNAEAEAIAAGGHLVTINDAAEESWLQTTFGGFDWPIFGYKSTWIGFNDQASEGNWEWSSGEAVTYTNWASFEPNNAGWHGEDYAVMNWGTDNEWNDLGSGRFTKYYGIIEVANVPEPASIAILALGLMGFASRRLKK